MRYLVACIVWLLSVLPAWAADECAVTLRGLRGTPDRPIVIDGGGITIDGMGVTSPMRVHDCRWVVVRNWNLCRSATDVLRITKSEYCRFEAICAWNAASENKELASTNYNCIGIHESHHCVFRDCAAWGTGRKTICASTDGDDLTWERCFAEYREPFDAANDIHLGKPRMTWAIAYNNSRNTYCDCIGVATTATGDRGFYRGVFAVDRMDDGSDPDTHLFRCLAISNLDVKAFANGTLEGKVDPPTGILPSVQFHRCLDATRGGVCDPSDLRELAQRWSTSPVLERVKTLAGVDILASVNGAAAVRPQPKQDTTVEPAP